MSTHEYPKEMIDPGADTPEAPERLRSFVERMEWSGWGYDQAGAGKPKCPDCGNWQDDGHADGCGLAALLAAPVAPAETRPIGDSVDIIRAAIDTIMAVVERRREPGWSYRNTITHNRNIIREQCAAIDEVLAAPVALAEPAADSVTPQMIEAGAKAAREYAQRTGGNSPEVIYCAMRAAAPKAAPVAPTPAQRWLPIETAPQDGRTILLGHHNKLGKWRTMRGQWMSRDCIDETWEEPDNGEPGWFETSAEADDVPNCWATDPTHWMPLPGAPEAA